MTAPQPPANRPEPAPTPSRELSGLAAVVTGSSSGIGRAIALALAAAGADVLVHARKSRARADEVAHQITALGGQSHVELADISDMRACQQLVDAAFQWRPELTIWVNNAGADTLTGNAGRWPFETKLEALWQTDVLGTIRLSRLVAERFAARRKSESADAAIARDCAIVNIGWDQAEGAGMAGESGQIFGATKGAVMAFTRSFAQTLAPHVRVNCVAPGWVRTAWGEQASQYWQDRAARESLAGRWGEPADIAAAVRFLASPQAAFINGQVLPVNGGFRANQV